MMPKPGPKLILAGAAVVVAAAVLFTFTVIAALHQREQPRPRPALHATVGSTLVDVAPRAFCTNVMSGQCDPSRGPERMPVEAGQAIVISLPNYITERPWFLTIQRYDTQRREPKLETITHVDPAKATLVLKSTDHLVLAAVEINVPSQYQDSSGNIIAQALWGIDTLPKDFDRTTIT